MPKPDLETRVTVSVIIPMFNGARFIGEAIESVFRQTRPAGEIIVVDDGSTDAGAAIAAAHPGVTVIRKAHTGIGHTLNCGLREAGGDFLGFLDADDRWLPDKLERQLQALEADRSVDLVFGHAQIFRMSDSAGGTAEEMGEVLPGVSRGCMLIRRSVYTTVGGFLDDPKAHEFLDWYGRVGAAGLKSVTLPGVVLQRRIHGANHGIVARADQRATYFFSLRAHLARCRPAGPHPT